MNSEISSYIEELDNIIEQISDERKKILLRISGYIRDCKAQKRIPKLNFICTHNSRRSHLAQVWTAVASHYFDQTPLECYSGGTEATAFNPNAVSALNRAGFQVKDNGGPNPVYSLSFNEKVPPPPLQCYSKTWDDPANPGSGFAAVMVCSDAEEHCPFIPGADMRISVTYDDPKEADGTDREQEVYDERCRQIAAEMFFMIRESVS